MLGTFLNEGALSNLTKSFTSNELMAKHVAILDTIAGIYEDGKLKEPYGCRRLQHGSIGAGVEVVI